MLVLAIDTALDACAAAVLDTETGALLAIESQTMARGHAEALMPLVERVMVAADTGFGDLDRIAVTTGPGSFTGLRVGIAAARGFALAADRPVVGVTTLSAFAAPFITDSGTHPIISAIDARHDQVYLQAVSGDGTLLLAPRLVPVDEALSSTAFGAPQLVGNAAKILSERWPKGAAQPVLVKTNGAPDIAWVAWLGAAADLATTPARPFYLRAADARPQASALPVAEAAPTPQRS